MTDKRAIFFDLDGVIIKNSTKDPANFRPWEDEWKSILDTKDFQKISAIFSQQFHSFLTGHVSVEESFRSVLPITSQHIIPKLLYSWFLYESTLELKVIDCIQALIKKGFIVCIATNQTIDRLEYLNSKNSPLSFQKMGVPVFASCEMKVTKAQESFFKKIQEKLALESANCLLVDDSEDNCRVAKLCDWKAVQFTDSDVAGSISKIENIFNIS